MRWQYTPHILPLVAAGLVSVLLAVHAWARRKTQGAIALSVLMVAVAWWSLWYAVELASADLGAKILWAKVQYPGIITTSVAWLVFVLQYTGHGRWLTRRNLVLLSVVPAVTVGLAWTNEAHGLVWQDVNLVQTQSGFYGWDAVYGCAFWVHLAYAYGALLLSGLLLLRTAIRSSRPYRGQAALLLIAAVLPWLGNALSILGAVPVPIDWTPLGFALGGLIVTLALFRFRLLDIVPVARDVVVESMADGVIVVDDSDRVVDLNPAAQVILGCEASQVVGTSLDIALKAHPDLLERYRGPADADTEVPVRVRPSGEDRKTTGVTDSEERHYTLRVSPLYSRAGRLTGRLLVLRDVTERWRAEEALRSQNELFEGLVAVARATAERPTLEATLQDALTTCSSLTGAEHGTLSILNEDGVVTHHLVMRGKEAPQEWREITGRVMDRGLGGWVAEHRELVVIDDVTSDERWLELPDSVSRVRSALAVPIASGPLVVGILTLTHSQPGRFTKEHAQMMQAAGDQLVLALRNAQVFDAQQRIAEQQGTLYHVLRSVVGQLDPEDVIEAALESIAQFAGWRNVVVALLNDSETEWEIHAYGDDLPSSVGQAFSIDQGIVGRALRTLETQCVPDVQADPDYVPGYRGTRSELVVPLRHGERLFGALDVESNLYDAFDERDVLLAESLADTMALALENASHYRETRQQATDLSALYTVTRMTSQSLALESVLSQALSSVLISLEFEAGLIALTDPTGGQLYLAAEYGLPRHLSERYSDEGMVGSLSEYVHLRQASVSVRDFRRETEGELGDLALRMARFGLRGYAGIPLLHRDESLGTMSLFSRRRKTFSANQMVLLEAIGRQVAAAVTNARLFQAIVNERQRLVTLIESSRDGIILVGLDQQILVVNTTAIGLLRLPGVPEDWMDRTLEEASQALRPHAPDAAEVMMAEMGGIQEGDEPPGEWECAVAPRMIQWFNLPVVADTTALGRLVVLRDVTEERMLARMRDDLTHTMVHDLRNPLTGISTALKLLDRKLTDKLTPAQHRLIEIADSSAQRMIDLVSAILDVSRLEGGRMPISPAPVSLRELVAETLSLQGPLAAASDLMLSSVVPSQLPDAWADSGLVARVLQNLVGNAIKFTPPGGRIQVGATHWQEAEDGAANRMLCVIVSDTGAGVPLELQGRLFEKFVVGDHENQGSGLGLAFCRLAVGAHGGRIWVESEPGKGSVFRFTLPAAEDGAV